MVSILLINPPRVRGHPVVREEFMEYSGKALVYPPLSILYTAAVLGHGFSVKVLDANAFGFGIDYVAETIKREEPDVVFIRCNAEIIDEDLKILRIAKGFGCMTVARSRVISDSPSLRDKMMKDNPYLNFFIDGEPEVVLPKLLKNMGKPEKVEGVTWLDGNVVKSGGTKPFVADISSIPLPAYEILPNFKFYKTGSFPGSSTVVMLSRESDYRARKPEGIIKELKELSSKYKINSFVFHGVIPKNTMVKIAKLMIKEKLKMRWAMCARVCDVDEYMESVLKKAGCVDFSYDIVSADRELVRGSDSMLKRIRNMVRKNVR